MTQNQPYQANPTARSGHAGDVADPVQSDSYQSSRAEITDRNGRHMYEMWSTLDVPWDLLDESIRSHWRFKAGAALGTLGSLIPPIA